MVALMGVEEFLEGLETSKNNCKLRLFHIKVNFMVTWFYYFLQVLYFRSFALEESKIMQSFLSWYSIHAGLQIWVTNVWSNKKKKQKWKAFWNTDDKEPKDERYLLTLNLRPFWSKVKGTLRDKGTLNIDILITSRNGEVKSIRITNKSTSQQNNEVESVLLVQMNISHCV